MAPAQNAFPAFLEPAARDNYARIHVKNNPSKHNTLARRGAELLWSSPDNSLARWKFGPGRREGRTFYVCFFNKTAGDRKLAHVAAVIWI
jgi:hypothetical protein